ncbi:asparagine synthetase B, partial [Bacillus paranthracis]|nr:asparagine synthetase B [Bacillus paranthracis]
AVWDAQKEQVFIARDRLGVKPLFYEYDSGRLLVGAGLEGILAHRDVKAEVALEGFSGIFGLGLSRTPGDGIY